jgi:mRNA interferase RelE/StbE
MNSGENRAHDLGYRVEIPSEVADIVRHLPPDVKRQVKQAVAHLGENPDAGKVLTGELAGLRSYRARRFRLVYQLTESARRLCILHVGHRRTIYEELAKYLGDQRPSP